MPDTSGLRVTAVTVTYGSRWPLLQRVIKAALECGVDSVILVDNGAKDPVVELSAEQFGNAVVPVVLETNTGSARGFSAGLQRAMQEGAEYILLLDDDNVLEPDALQVLTRSHVANHERGLPKDNLIVSGFRPSHMVDVSKLDPDRINPTFASFMGFDVLELHKKVARRLFGSPENKASDEIVLHVAPWSGMLFHRSVLERHGFPEERFVVYVDDTEFAWRVTASGGKVIVCTKAQIQDIDTSWNTKAAFATSMHGFVLGNSDMRAFYSIRNRTYFELHCRPRSRMRTLNRLIYRELLRGTALLYRRSARWALINEAFSDGESGRLGNSPNYPLPQPAVKRPVPTDSP